MTARRDELTDAAADAAIEQACRLLRLPTIRDRHGEIAAAAARQQSGYKVFLTELLSLECDDREAAAVPDRGLRHGQVAPADRAGPCGRRERVPGPVRHRRRAGQRAGRGIR